MRKDGKVVIFKIQIQLLLLLLLLLLDINFDAPVILKEFQPYTSIYKIFKIMDD